MKQKRIEKLQQKMKALDLDGFLVTSKENRQYLTGFTGYVWLGFGYPAYRLFDDGFPLYGAGETTSRWL